MSTHSFFQNDHHFACDFFPVEQEKIGLHVGQIKLACLPVQF